MKRPAIKTRTFNRILEGVETTNAEHLMKKARTANLLAKTTNDRRTRRRAYRIKTDALLNLRHHFPARTTVTIDPRMPWFIIVEYESMHKGVRHGLHAPAHEFAS